MRIKIETNFATPIVLITKNRKQGSCFEKQKPIHRQTDRQTDRYILDIITADTKF